MDAMGFHDHFSAQAACYARHRPTYPAELFAWLATITPGRRRALDVATGNGQAAMGLAAHFTQVVASDASRAQLRARQRQAPVAYLVAHAAEQPLGASQFDLVTVAQALHWFALEPFYTEVRRLLRPGGLLAVWSYALGDFGDDVNRVVQRYYHDVVGTYWPPERRHIETGYRTLPFPFAAREAPPFAMTAAWDLPALHGYLSSWSASQRYREALAREPLDVIAADLRAAWGDPVRPRAVHWPLALKVGTVGPA